MIPASRNRSPEIVLALLLCRTPLDDEARSTVESLLSQPPDWALLFRLAAQWQLEPVVFANLRLHFRETIPASVLARAAEREGDARATALTRALQLVEVVKQLRAIGVQSIVLKGPAIGIVAYGDASMRTFADIDLLLRREDLGRARDMLLLQGHARDYPNGAEEALIRNGHALEFSGAGPKVELHWTLLSRHLQFQFDVDDIWNEATTLPLAGETIDVLAPHHHFLFLCAHGAKHEWERIRWICDLAQLAETLSADDVAATMALARRMHGRRLLSLAVRVAREVIGAPMKMFADYMLVSERDTIRATNATMHRVGLSATGFSDDAGWLARQDPDLRTLMFWVRARERARDRLSCLASVVFLPTEKDERSGRLGSLVRPFRLAGRAARRVVGK